MSEKRIAAGLGRPNFDNAAEKRIYNERLFDVVAPAYRRVTALLSFGQDVRWKRKLIRELPDLKRPLCVDVACGSGDLLGLLCRKYPDGRIVGVDQNRAMIRAGDDIRDGREGTLRLKADMATLPLANDSVDVVTGGYAIRNAPDLDVVLSEIARVLKPGGIAAFLDFSRSPSRLGSKAALALLGIWGRLFGVLFHRNGAVYGYISESLSHFPNRRQLTEILAAHGLETLRTSGRFGGMLELRWTRK